jgi:hypothetical protein
MFPSLVDGGPHMSVKTMNFYRPAVVLGTEAHDIDLGHHRDTKTQRCLSFSYSAAKHSISSLTFMSWVAANTSTF